MLLKWWGYYLLGGPFRRNSSNPSSVDTLRRHKRGRRLISPRLITSCQSLHTSYVRLCVKNIRYYCSLRRTATDNWFSIPQSHRAIFFEKVGPLRGSHTAACGATLITVQPHRTIAIKRTGTMATNVYPISYASSLPMKASALPPDLSPASFDTLPVLTSILTRLQTGINSPSNTIASSSPAQNQSQPAPIDKNPFSTAPLTIKDIPAATDDLKQRVRKARAHVAQLPDIGRTIAEQEHEIRKIEARIAEQRTALEQLKELGTRIVQKDVANTKERME